MLPLVLVHEMKTHNVPVLSSSEATGAVAEATTPATPAPGRWVHYQLINSNTDTSHVVDKKVTKIRNTKDR